MCEKGQGAHYQSCTSLCEVTAHEIPKGWNTRAEGNLIHHHLICPTVLQRRILRS